MKILVTGPQGSGKTTQAKLLAQYLKVPFIGIGESLRQKAKEESAEALTIKESLDKGVLVDDGIVSNVARNRFSQDDCLGGFVVDGYPRTLDQLGLFDPKYDLVIYLSLNDEEVTKRLTLRGREDDTPGLIAQRLKIYHSETKDLIDYYEGLGILKKVDGTKIIPEIFEEIKKLING